MLILRVITAWMCMVSLACATTFYVGKSGSDANSCATAQSSTAANRKLTIAGGVGCVSAANGDIVTVGDGTYAEQYVATTSHSGTNFTNAMTLQGECTTTCALIQPTSSHQDAIDIDRASMHYIIIKNFRIDCTNTASNGAPRQCIKLHGDATVGFAHHIRLQGLDVSHTGIASTIASFSIGGAAIHEGGYHEFLNLTLHDSGIGSFDNAFYIQNGHNLFQDIVMHDMKGAGIALSQQNGGHPEFNVINRVLCYNMGLTSTKGDCILLAGANAANNLITNVIGVNSTDWSCINAEESGPVNNEFYFNTCYGNPLYGINLGGSGNIAKYNIAYNNTTANTRDATGSNTISNNITTNPTFVNTATRDFHLQSGSNAIGAGADPGGGKVTSDYDNVSRPQGAGWDAGAFEYIASGSVTGTGRRSKGVMVF